jgi:hypothetical protein
MRPLGQQQRRRLRGVLEVDFCVAAGDDRSQPARLQCPHDRAAGQAAVPGHVDAFARQPAHSWKSNGR